MVSRRKVGELRLAGGPPLIMDVEAQFLRQQTHNLILIGIGAFLLAAAVSWLLCWNLLQGIEK